MENSKLRILLIEKQPSEVDSIASKLNGIPLNFSLEAIRTVEEAIMFLEGRVAVQGAERKALPDLILLDGTPAGQNSRDIVTRLKREHQLKPIPVIVLTADDEDGGLREEKVAWVQKSCESSVLKKAFVQFRLCPV